MLDKLFANNDPTVSDLMNRALPPAVTLNMNYDDVEDPVVRDMLRDAAAEIHLVINNAKWVVGNRLLIVRRDLGEVQHGLWLRWLTEEFHWKSEKTAQNYMNSARLIEVTGAESAEIPDSAQYIVGAHEPEIVEQAAPVLLDMHRKREGSGRNGAVNQEDAKRVVNEVAGETVYKPPQRRPAKTAMFPPSSPAPESPDVPKTPPISHDTDRDAQTCVVRIDARTAREILNAIEGGALGGFLTEHQESLAAQAFRIALGD